MNRERSRRGPTSLPLSIGDGGVMRYRSRDRLQYLPEIFRYWLQGGRITVGFLGGAQVDRFGNLNTTVIPASTQAPRFGFRVRWQRAGNRKRVVRPGLHRDAPGVAQLREGDIDFLTSMWSRTYRNRAAGARSQNKGPGSSRHGFVYDVPRFFEPRAHGRFTASGCDARSRFTAQNAHRMGRQNSPSR